MCALDFILLSMIVPTCYNREQSTFLMMDSLDGCGSEFEVFFLPSICCCIFTQRTVQWHHNLVAYLLRCCQERNAISCVVAGWLTVITMQNWRNDWIETWWTLLNLSSFCCLLALSISWWRKVINLTDVINSQFTPPDTTQLNGLVGSSTQVSVWRCVLTIRLGSLSSQHILGRR